MGEAVNDGTNIYGEHIEREIAMVSTTANGWKACRPQKLRQLEDTVGGHLMSRMAPDIKLSEAVNFMALVAFTEG